MSVLKVVLSAKGSMTQLPDSQKVFGALIYLYSANVGSEQATNLVRSIRDGEVFLSVSNVIPDDYFPLPVEYIIGQKHLHDKTDKSEETTKEYRTALKRKHFVPKNELIEFVKKKPKDMFQINKPFDDYYHVQSGQAIKNYIESVDKGIPFLETQVFSIPSIHLLRSDQTNEDHPLIQFAFYIQIDDEVLFSTFKRLLLESCEMHHIFKLGKRTSQGMNLFEIVTLESPEGIRPSNYYLNLGMLLPNDIVYEKSVLTLYTSERRPYEADGFWDSNMTKRFISFIGAGSIICSENRDLKDLSKSIQSPFRPERDITFGNAFMYPLELEGGR